MHSLINLMSLIALWLVLFQIVFSQTLGARMNQLNIRYHALITDTFLHNPHTTDPYPKAILSQLAAVKEQIHDMTDEIRCVEKKESDVLCWALLSIEERLEREILRAGLKWREWNNGGSPTKVKANAESAQSSGGWVVANPVHL